MSVQEKILSAAQFLDAKPGFGDTHKLPYKNPKTGEALTISTIKGCTIAGELGIPLCGAEAIISDGFCHESESDFEALTPEIRKPKFHVDASVMPLYGKWSDGFWHWMFEQLPSVVLAEAWGYKGLYVVPPRWTYIYESFDILNIDSNRVIDATGESFSSPSVTLVKKVMGSWLGDYPEILLLMRNRLIEGAARLAKRTEPGPRRVYISRNAGPKIRKVENESELLSILKPYGFTTVHLEPLTLFEQINLFTNAEILIGPHGAGMIHSLFMPPKSTVIELFSPKYVNLTSFPPSQALHHRYRMVVSEVVSEEGYTYGDDIHVRRDILEHQLKEALSSST